MSQSVDPHHDRHHVEKMLSDLDYLLKSVPNLVSEINFTVLLPAICWHDIWISKQKTKSLLQLIAQQIVEGRKSANIFNHYSKKLLPSKQVQDVAYCIRKHSSFQIIPPFTIEAKILIDLDKLELWNVYRFLGKRNTLQSEKVLFTRYIVRFYYSYSAKISLYFRELESHLHELEEKFWKEMK